MKTELFLPKKNSQRGSQALNIKGRKWTLRSAHSPSVLKLFAFINVHQDYRYWLLFLHFKYVKRDAYKSSISDAARLHTPQWSCPCFAFKAVFRFTIEWALIMAAMASLNVATISSPVISSFARLWSYPKKARWSFYDVIYDESNVVAAQDLGSYRKFGEWVC